VVIASIIRKVSTSETSVNLYQIKRRNIPQVSHLHSRRRENLISHKVWKLRHYMSLSTLGKFLPLRMVSTVKNGCDKSL
jgi:hypothetical protein